LARAGPDEVIEWPCCLLQCVRSLLARSDRSRFGSLTLAFAAKRAGRRVDRRPDGAQLFDMCQCASHNAMNLCCFVEKNHIGGSSNGSHFRTQCPYGTGQVPPSA
jgi:hypothetical protein